MLNKKKLTALGSLLLLTGSLLCSAPSYAWGKNSASPAQESTASANTNAKAAKNNEAATGRVNINTASVETLQNMKFMSKTKAQKIVKYREEHGPFKSLDELLSVKCRGIHQSWLDKIKDMLTI